MTRVLVIDDDESVRMAIEALLRHQDCVTVLADNGRLGARTFEASHFDAVMVDIFMPGMDGLETMRLIHRKQPKMPIIVISGRPLAPDLAPEPDYLGMATKLGAVCSLPKPFKPATLLATVASCLAAATPPVSLFAPNGNAATGT